MINLLPPQYKEELRQEENWRLTLILGVLFLLFLFSLILILFSIRIYIQGQADSLKVLINLGEKTLETSEISELREKVNLANQNLLKLNSFYKSQTNVTELLEKIFKTMPSETYLTGFSWQKSTSQVSLSGFSPNREILFQFKKSLEEEKEFAEVYFPPQGWIKPTDIDFNVTFKITNSAIK